MTGRQAVPSSGPVKDLAELWTSLHFFFLVGSSEGRKLLTFSFEQQIKMMMEPPKPQTSFYFPFFSSNRKIKR